MASSRLKRPAEEAYTVELNEVPEVVVDGYDWEEENIIVVEDIDVIRLKLGKLIQEYKIHFLNPPRAQKKLLVLDVDHTIFHFQPLAQTAEEQQRPYLHEFLTACYAEYDLMIWSASGMKAVEVKMRFVGVLSDPNYRIAALLDHNAMIVVMTNAGDICCKPLALIWANYPEHYHKGNTIMIDDRAKNFVLNPENGLVIRPFRKSHQERSKDRELVALRKYLLAISKLEDLSKLGHRRWKEYLDCI